MCERALTSLKYFSEEAPEYHVMAVGSLLGVAVKVDLAKDSPIEQSEIRQMLLNSYIADMTKYANQSDTVRIFEAYDSLSDMGIMSARLGMTLKALQGKETEHFRGILTENYVAIALKTNGYDLHYWESNNTAEVDFLIQKDSHVIPVECKAGKYVKAKSMMVYMEQYAPVYAIRISARNFGMVNGIKSVPLYSAFCV